MAVVLQHNPSHLLRHPSRLSTRPRRQPEVSAGKIEASAKDGPRDVLKHPRHPEYKELNHRLFSFLRWEYESVQSSRLLAGNGFFYTGSFDIYSHICLFVFYLFLFPKHPILDPTKLKEFADDNFEFDENGRELSESVEKTVGKGEIAR